MNKKAKPNPTPQSMSAPEGIPVVLGGKSYTMPPLNAVVARRYWERILALETGDDPDPLGLAVTLVTACLRRNHPEVTEDWVAEHLDLDNHSRLASMTLGRGAFQRWCEANPGQRGNVPAPQPQPQPMGQAGTGAPSMPASPRPPAGDIPTSTP